MRMVKLAINAIKTVDHALGLKFTIAFNVKVVKRKMTLMI